MNYKKMVRVMAMVMSASVALTPVTAFANETEQEVVAVEAVETASEEVVANDDVVVETADETVEVVAAEEVVDETTADQTVEVVDETTVDETVAEETVVAEDADAEVVAEAEAVADDAAEVVEDTTADVAEATVATPGLDKKALKCLNDAASFQDSLKENSFKTGLAATNQVDRCRNLAKNLLVYKLNYMDGMMVIGTSYDMFHGDNNYICVVYKDTATGEVFEKYYDFYMQDSNGNNITNAFKYHTVDRITIVEKGALTGEKKLGMYKYPTFESKSNGTVVFDYDSYSQLISQENRDAVSGMIQ